MTRNRIRQFIRLAGWLSIIALFACTSPFPSPMAPPPQAETQDLPPEVSPTTPAIQGVKPTRQDTTSETPAITMASPTTASLQTATLQPTLAIPSPDAPLEPGTPPPKHVILIIVDTLRADHVSSYGYARQTTPYLDALVAEEGVRFERAVSIANWTCPSIAGLLTGETPSSLGVTYKRYNPSIPAKAKTLAEYMQRAGYYTAGFATTYCVRARLGVDQGFDYYDDELSAKTYKDKARADEVNQRALAWLKTMWLPKRESKEPLFLFLYYFDPHVWYDPPPPYDQLYDSTYTGSLTPEVYGIGEDVISGKIKPSPGDIEHLKALYDGEITFWDDNFGRLFAALQQMGLLEDTLLVVTADHGELFGEHGKWTHGNTLNEELVHVPLLMRYTGVIPPGTVVESPVQSMDLTPTILDWAGVQHSGPFFAMSVRSLAEGSGANLERAVYSEVDGFIDENHPLVYILPPHPMQAIQKNGWKLIHHQGHADLDELYQLQPASPYETTNLIRSEPQMAQELLKELLAWFSVEP